MGCWGVVLLRTVFDFFFQQWTIFAIAAVLGTRFLSWGLRGTVPRDMTGDYRYAGPTFFIVLGVVMQLPLLLRLVLV
jgi:hypothetical protein